MMLVPHAARFRSLLASSLLLAVSVLLSACGVSPGLSSPPNAAIGSVATVSVAPDALSKDVALRHGGEVLVWRPEAGFAVLGFRSDASALEVTSLEANAGVFSVVGPQLQAQGWNLWGGGWNLWGGGWNLWGGGQLSSFEANRAAWAQINLSEAQALAPKAGAGVVVAVLDSGLDVSHPGFAGRLAPRALWRDFVDGDRLPNDEPGGPGYGHGTAVAGVILQVAPQATILPLRVLKPDGSGDLSAVLQALDYAVAQRVDIVHMSLGTPHDLASLRAITYYAAARGVRVVASAGNSGDEQVTYPAGYGVQPGLGKNLLSVGSVDAHNRKSAFSSYGARLELLAPGERLRTLAPGQRVLEATGTSFAAPLASGALALGLAERPGHSTDALLRSATSLDAQNPAFAGHLGAGRLDAARYLRQVLRRP